MLNRYNILGSGVLLLGLIVVGILLMSQGWTHSGFTEHTETVVRTATGSVVEVITADDADHRDRVKVMTSDSPIIRIEATKHGFGWTSAQAEASATTMEVDVRQNGNRVRVLLPRRFGIVLLGHLPYVSVRITVPEGVEVIHQ